MNLDAGAGLCPAPVKILSWLFGVDFAKFESQFYIYHNAHQGRLPIRGTGNVRLFFYVFERLSERWRGRLEWLGRGSGVAFGLAEPVGCGEGSAGNGVAVGGGLIELIAEDAADQADRVAGDVAGVFGHDLVFGVTGFEISDDIEPLAEEFGVGRLVVE